DRRDALCSVVGYALRTTHTRNELLDLCWVESTDSIRAQAIQRRHHPASDLVCDRAPNRRCDCEAMSRESGGDDQPIKSRPRAGERKLSDALRFWPAPGAVQPLLPDCR